ncbi:MAG: hypothetical protein G01um101419_727 [Parcubacteria group bacterium Gr01-1014_19]|nr:MAG: hypothetical protein G01um101419_727 [Parcubacteria group bacterium Gr01-1014_19]
MRSITNFITKVQNSDETTKRFWVVVCSSISMLLVVSLWLGYMNVTITSIPGPGGLTTNDGRRTTTNNLQLTTDDTEVRKPGFFAVFTAGVKIIFDELKERTLAKKDIMITKENQEVNFVAEGVEPIRGATLPN